MNSEWFAARAAVLDVGTGDGPDSEIGPVVLDSIPEGVVWLGMDSEWNNPRVDGEGDTAAAYRQHLWWCLRHSGETLEAALADLHGKRFAAPSFRHGAHAQVLADAALWAARRQRGGSMDTRGRYDPADVAGFKYTRGPLGFLSNFAPSPLGPINGLRFGTAEALYQACRYPHHRERQEEIAACATPREAKSVARRNCEVESREDWLDVRERVMAWVVWVKAATHFGRFRAALDEAEGRPMVELSARDGFWGMQERNGELVGSNLLGRIIEGVRDTFDTGWEPVVGGHVMPPGCGSFLVGGRAVTPLRFVRAVPDSECDEDITATNSDVKATPSRRAPATRQGARP